MASSALDTIRGTAELTSPWFSSAWRLRQDGRDLAALRRRIRTYVSVVEMRDGRRITIAPGGIGVVTAIEEGERTTAETARIIRRSWLGRLWTIHSPRFSLDLVSDHRPRRWHLAVANAPVAGIEGSLVSYNHVAVDSSLGVPLTAVLLSWHVIARPWEAAAEPRGLVPVEDPPSGLAKRIGDAP